jgi:hypothetical protein
VSYRYNDLHLFTTCLDLLKNGGRCVFIESLENKLVTLMHNHHDVVMCVTHLKNDEKHLLLVAVLKQKPRLFKEVIECSPNIIQDLNIDQINLLRKALNQVLSESDEGKHPICDTMLCAELAYNCLLKLAELSPINNDDHYIQKETKGSEKIFVSTGHQFDIHKLIQYHNMRIPLPSENGEKKLLNPITLKPFSLKDTQHIHTIAKKSHIKLKDFSTVDHVSSATQIQSGFWKRKCSADQQHSQEPPSPQHKKNIKTDRF